MIRFSPSPQVGLSVALGLLLASASGPAGAVWSADDEATATRHFELVPTGRAAQLPPELRAQGGQPSLAEALGLPEAAGRHTVQLHWVVREGAGLSGYRVTLVAADGLPGNLAARWWVAPAEGVPVGDGLTAYSAEVALALDEPAPVAAAVEAIDFSGHAVLLGVRRSVAAVDPAPAETLNARPSAVSTNPTAVPFSRAAPTAHAAAPASTLFSLPAAARAHAPRAAFAHTSFQGGSASGRGPPPARRTTSWTGA
jgi:hypothetical protein